jgi:hypothetical protein
VKAQDKLKEKEVESDRRVDIDIPGELVGDDATSLPEKCLCQSQMCEKTYE